MSIERDPGFVELSPGMVAIVDQQRAEMVAALRETLAVSATVIDRDGDMRHWALYALDDEFPGEFLVYAVVRAWRDAIAAVGCEHDELYRMVLDSISRGIGE